MSTAAAPPARPAAAPFAAPSRLAPPPVPERVP